MQSRLSIHAVLALVVSVAVCEDAAADDPSQTAQVQADKAPVALPIVTVNVKRAFDEYAGFQKGTAKLKAEAGELVEEYSKRVTALEAKKKQLGRDDLSEEARKKLNEELLRAQADLATFTPLRKQELLEREGRLYASVYQEIQDSVAKLAHECGTQVVFRGHALDPKTLSTSDNSFAVLFQKGIDKTDELVRLLNGSETKGNEEIDSKNTKDVPEQFRVAVADLSKIMTAYPKHDGRLASLKEKTQDLERDLADEQNKLKELATQAGVLDKGSSEYAAIATKAALLKAKAEARLKAKKEQLDADTARAAEQTLEELTILIGDFSNARGLSLVLNVGTTTIDPKDPASVLKGVAKPVVYHANHDITDDIIKSMNGDVQDSSDSADNDNSEEKKRFVGKVAVIDMAAVYKDNERFAAQMAGLQENIAKFSAYLQNRQNALEELKSLLNALEEGTEAHQNTTKQLARESAELKVEVELKKRELTRQEAEVYAKTYGEIRETLIRVAHAREIGIVVRFHRQQIDADDRKSILSGLNRTVVFQNEVDLTGEVIRLTKAASAVELR